MSIGLWKKLFGWLFKKREFENFEEFHYESHNWSNSVECPKCRSRDTRFVEPHYEISIYECNVCGCRFEIEEVR